jgi:hypothetical protein
MLSWYLRRGFWDLIAFGKFFAARPVKIKPPPAKWDHIEPKPMIEAIPEVPLKNVMVCPRAAVPKDERNWRNTTFYDIQVWLYTVISPMHSGLQPIDADPQVALKRAYNGLRRTQFHAPKLPAEYLGPPDLGSLAVRGPYACYTRHFRKSIWEWDLRMLADYEHHDGLMNIGSRVWFREDTVRRSLRAYRIDCTLGQITPADPDWDRATKIALCAVSTHLSLVRHFNWVHLAGGAQLAIATRNSFRRNHPLCRLLWPYTFGTQQSNDMVTRGQMVRGGDFETTFSFTFDGMCKLFDDTYVKYKNRVNDPEEDAKGRGLLNVSFDTPTQRNLEALFDVMHRFVKEYLEVYFPRNATGSKDIRHDLETLAWLDELNRLVPNGVGVTAGNINWDKFARMLAGQLYLVTAQHEILGSFLWNYQLWTHRQPARIYQDFQPEPLDVYQRLVNANYNLNVHRRALMHNFTDLALDDHARAVMLRFHSELVALQARMDSQPHTVWRVHPRQLKVNINA